MEWEREAEVPTLPTQSFDLIDAWMRQAPQFARGGYGRSGVGVARGGIFGVSERGFLAEHNVHLEMIRDTQII